MSISVKETGRNLLQIRAVDETRQKTCDSYLLTDGQEAALIGTVPEQVLSEWILTVKTIIKERQADVRYAAVFDAASVRAGYGRIREAFPNAKIVSSDGICFEISGAPLETDGVLTGIRRRRKLPIGSRTLTCISQSGKEGRSFTVSVDEEGIFEEGENGVRFLKDDSAAGDVKTAGSASAGHGAGNAGSASAGHGAGKAGSASAGHGPGTAEADKHAAAVRKICIPYTNELYVPELAGAVRKGLSESFEEGTITAELLLVEDQTDPELIRKKFEEADVIIPGCIPPQGKLSGTMRSAWDMVRAGDLTGRKGSYFAFVRGSGISSECIGQRMLEAGIDVLDSGFTVFGRLTLQDLKNAEDFGYNLGCMLQQKLNPRGSRLVKCIVCGEIFDASLGICPVCGAGLDQCVPISEDEITCRNDTDREYLILGGGCAAVNAADAIRMRDKTGRITILTAENYLPVNRPMLTKDLNAAAHADQIALHPESWYEERQIRVLTGVRAEKIDADQKTVSCSDGQERTYDRLIYALGSESFVPPFSGTDLKGVITLRHV